MLNNKNKNVAKTCALTRAFFFSFCAEHNEARKGFTCALAMYLLAVLYIHAYISVSRVRKHETQSYLMLFLSPLVLDFQFPDQALHFLF